MADRSKEKTREEILDSASRLLRSRGIAGTSVAEVMSGAGLTVGGFYAHFASKVALVDATLQRTLSTLRAQLLSGIDALPEGTRAFEIVRRYLSRAHRDAMETGCPLPAVGGELAASGQFAETLAGQLDLLIDDLERLGAGTRQEAIAAMAMMVGALTLARATRGTPASDEILRACRAHAQGEPGARKCEADRRRSRRELASRDATERTSVRPATVRATKVAKQSLE